MTNFEDEIADGGAEHSIVKSDPKLKDYHRRVQRFIVDHQDHITIRRLRNNEPVSKTDIDALESILFSEESQITRKNYEITFGEKPLGLLVRSVVGLSRKAAKEAFSEFLEKGTLQPDQMTFLNEIVEYLVKNGTMEPKVMFQPPFTNMSMKGVVGVFNQDESKKVVELVRDVNSNAGVA